MKTVIKSCFLALVSLFSLKVTAQSGPVQASALIGCWADSREENPSDGTVGIYRPCDYKVFPASRFRYKMDLKPEGLCSYSQLASDDAHKTVKGYWRFSEKTGLLEIMDAQQRVIEKLKVLGVESDLLKIKKN